jgi:hypothetical protein
VQIYERDISSSEAVQYVFQHDYSTNLLSRY